MKQPDELLYDSEASLRLVDHAIEELNALGVEVDQETPAFLQHIMTQPGGFAELSRTLLRAYAETARIAQTVQRNRSLIENGGIENLHHMQGKINEISATAEVATADVLDAVGRGIAAIDRLAGAEGAQAKTRQALVAQAREDLTAALGHLQFQDITSQQLNYLSSRLLDMRSRLEEMARLFGPYFVSFANHSIGAFDPAASTENVEARQAVADEIFGTNPGSARKSA
jgi:hypothetical protein